MPIVIDSPNQQAQDDFNMPLILKFIGADLPDGMQLIVGSETDKKLYFDKKIYLDVPYGLLEEDQYDSLSSMLDPLSKVMYENL